MIDDCNEYSNNKIIIAEENRRKFILRNNSNLYINKVKVDNCYITSGQKCDYLFEIIRDDNIEIVFYIELKGSDINHAIEQIESTLKYCNKIHTKSKKECYIVLSKFPSAGTSTQILKKKFKKKNNIQLYINSKIKTVII